MKKICCLVLLSFALGQPTFAESSINVLLPGADSVQQNPTYHSEDVRDRIYENSNSYARHFFGKAGSNYTVAGKG